MIGDPPSAPGSYGPVRRENSLLCFAAIMLIIGVTIIQIAVGFGMLGSYLPIYLGTLLITILAGMILVLIGIFLMWKWYKSGI